MHEQSKSRANISELKDPNPVHATVGEGINEVIKGNVVEDPPAMQLGEEFETSCRTHKFTYPHDNFSPTPYSASTQPPDPPPSPVETSPLISTILGSLVHPKPSINQNPLSLHQTSNQVPYTIPISDLPLNLMESPNTDLVMSCSLVIGSDCTVHSFSACSSQIDSSSTC